VTTSWSFIRQLLFQLFHVLTSSCKLQTEMKEPEKVFTLVPRRNQSPPSGWETKRKKVRS